MGLTPTRRVAWIQETFQVSTVRSCQLAQFTRAAWYRTSTARDQSALSLRIRDLANAREKIEAWRQDYTRYDHTVHCAT